MPPVPDFAYYDNLMAPYTAGDAHAALLFRLGILLSHLESLRLAYKHIQAGRKHPNFPIWKKTIESMAKNVNDQINVIRMQLILGVCP